jgi:hypothetical protein
MGEHRSGCGGDRGPVAWCRDDATKAEFNDWAQVNMIFVTMRFDGTNLRSLNISSEPIVIPPIYGLKGSGSRRLRPMGPSRTGTATSV